MAEADGSGGTVSAEDRAAMRAFLQRSEVRLSTLHRIATALLSGAGILVLLPSVERDSVVSVLRALLDGDLTARRALLVLCVAASVVLTVTVIWMLLVELTRFYFHANHVEHDGRSVFTPRFTLTGLRLPDDELGPAAAAALATSRGAAHNVGLLVPSNDRSRARIDRQVGAYPGLVLGPVTDDATRADALFELAASRARALADEVAKVEFGMARHMLRIQVVVLRYVKALLVVVTTVLAAFVMAAAVQGPTPVAAADERWVAATMALWAPAVILAASSPVRWLDRLLRAEGATQLELRRDPELTHLEDVTARVGVLVWLCATVAGVSLVVDQPVTATGRASLVVALVGAAGLQVLALHRWAGGGVSSRLLGLGHRR